MAGSDTLFAGNENRKKNGIRNAKKTVETQGLQLFHGKLLPGLLSCHGVKRTPHGGVAILAPKDFGTEFDPNSDQSGLYLKILETKRAHAVWVQVSKNLKVLVINIYCRTGASQDRVVQQTNNDLLQDLFTFACQFGSIPVIIAGDFQLPPLQYDAVSQAVNFHQWNDSLAVTEEPGIFRPLTYSADGTFTGPGDGCSSIHGVLTNATASAALFRAEVLPLLKVQHRPIQVTFKWDHLWQRGFILYKTAPLCLRGLNQHVQPDSSLNHIEQCHDLTIDECWSRANHIAIDALLAQGASWGPGPRQRGEAVQTKSKVICPGQHPNGCAVTKRSSWLHKEASEKSSFFHTAPLTAGPRKVIQQRTIQKAWNRLFWLQAPCLWPWDQQPSLLQTLQALQWVQDAITMDEIKILASQNSSLEKQNSEQRSCRYFLRVPTPPESCN